LSIPERVLQDFNLPNGPNNVMAIFVAFEKKKARFLENMGFYLNKCWLKEHFF
jgi:hypothetical protein